MGVLEYWRNLGNPIFPTLHDSTTPSLLSLFDHLARNPVRWPFFGCCASADGQSTKKMALGATQMTFLLIEFPSPYPSPRGRGKKGRSIRKSKPCPERSRSIGKLF